MNENIGKKLGEYLIEEHLGTGGFGSVYRVSKEDDGGKYFYAMKHITFPTPEAYNDVYLSMNKNQEDTDEYFKSMLRDVVSEFNAMREMSTKNSRYFVTYYDHQILGTPRKYDVLIRMELLTPYNVYCNKKVITVADVIRLGLEIGEALNFCHQKRIIHRDIKEGNIFVNADGDFKLGDFGVAKTLDKTTQMMSRKGTPFYMAPEILLNQSYSFNVDIYALAMVLYKLLNQSRYPFMPPYPQRYTNMDIENAQAIKLKGEKPKLPSLAKNELGEFVVRALGSAKERPQNAADFVAELQEILNALPPSFLNTVVSEPMDLDTQGETQATSDIFTGQTHNATVGMTIGAHNATISDATYASDNKNVFTQEREEPVRPELVEKMNLAKQKTAPRRIRPSIKVIEVLIPMITVTLLVLGINITVHDLLITENEMVNSLVFRCAVLGVLGLITLYYLAKILIYPDSKTLIVAKESKRWKAEALSLVVEMERFVVKKTMMDENNNSYRNIKGELLELKRRIRECKSFWKMTNMARQYEMKATDGIKEVDALINQEHYLITIGQTDQFKTLSDTQKSEFGLIVNRVKRFLEQREANLQ